MTCIRTKQDCLSCLGDSMEVAHSMLNDQILCDVTIRVGNKKFRVHRFVLAIACPYFYTMFSAGLQESKTDEIELHIDLSPDIFDQLIEMFYTGQIEINEVNVFDLFAASDYFQLNRLKQSCELFFQNWMVPDRSFEVWELSRLYGCPVLRAYCERYFQDRFFDIIKSKPFLEITADCFSKLFSGNGYTKDARFENKVVLTTVHAWLEYVPENRSPDYDELSRWKDFSTMLRSIESSSHLKKQMMAAVRSEHPEYCEDKVLDKMEIPHTILRTSLRRILGIQAPTSTAEEASNSTTVDGIFCTTDVNVSRQTLNKWVYERRHTGTSVYISNETSMKVIAVAWMDDKICVLCSSRMIYIFPDHEPFSEGIVEIDLSLHSVLNPTDMVGCAAERSLCIIDSSECILAWVKVPTSTAIVEPNKAWIAIIIRHRPLRLSCAQPNQVVILQKSKDTKSFFLGFCSMETGVNNKAIAESLLPDEIGDPTHAIKLPNGDIVVAYTSAELRPGRACLARFSGDEKILLMVWHEEACAYLPDSIFLTTPLTYCNIDQLVLRDNGEIFASMKYSTETTSGETLCLVRLGVSSQKIAQYERDGTVTVDKTSWFCYIPSKKQILYCGQGISSVYVAILNVCV